MGDTNGSQSCSCEEWNLSVLAVLYPKRGETKGSEQKIPPEHLALARPVITVRKIQSPPLSSEHNSLTKNTRSLGTPRLSLMVNEF